MVQGEMPEAADMLNLGFLSDSERENIQEVLQRDEEFRQAEQERVRGMKTELLDLKRRGAKRGSGRYSEHSCARCQHPLSRLKIFSNKCKMCNHHVCSECRTALPDRSWVCHVCAIESELKKRTGDWFYDQRSNRFSMTPLNELVRASLKKKPQANKRETTGEVLLRSTEINPDLPIPVPRVRQINPITDNKGHSKENSGSVASRESFELKEDVCSKSTCSDLESAENKSIKTCTDSGHVTPEQQRSETPLAPPSPTGSTVSSPIAPVKVVSVDMEANNAPEVKSLSPSPIPETDVDKLFKKSIKRDPKPPEHVSALDLHDGIVSSEALMGSRSKSVPGLNMQEDGEEDEDIDSLVSFHKSTIVSGSYSLHSSMSTLGSTMSIYSEAGDFDSVEVSGDLVFSLCYDEHTQSLHVFIKECQGLAYGNAAKQLSNPYVKCYLLPDKTRLSKKKTSIKRNTVNPVYKETLKYSISRTQLFTRSVLISVWHYGRFSHNAFLGEVEVPLDTRDLDTPYTDRMTLLGKSASAAAAGGPASPFAQDKGELVISLKYVTPKNPITEKNKDKKAVIEGGELHVLIKGANKLIPMKPGGTLDSFVKGYLFPTKAKTTKRKTPVVKKNLDPQYDHTFVYKELALEQLGEMCLELTVWDREALSSNEFLGGLRLGSGKGTVKSGKVEVEMDSVGEEVSLWEKMMQYPDSWAEGTLPLRSTMVTGK
ncbi:synaptotagmin-like protein 4 isoform X2 [Cyclopterus lumpus]|uniref:Synaptotagmin-like protein 4 n=1 Tax=Cyclopterus lumpus TaxID=8103 RepID=A0A8C2YYD5_CYCLU|nr:synaptotagmin-like protein 4 isoform X2 [Cyclopterus lumpus]XP_034398932.1 synaptotagmin-like protein 4 isoform X2 [Cyclopterus lumpus]XP_034398933.1 synaptotagmin-like protein 4 isoform X2 [Cyclopterus lumpus]